MCGNHHLTGFPAGARRAYAYQKVNPLLLAVSPTLAKKNEPSATAKPTYRHLNIPKVSMECFEASLTWLITFGKLGAPTRRLDVKAGVSARLLSAS
jgi:hypothetical protein